MVVNPGALILTPKFVNVGGIKTVVIPAILATGAGCTGGRFPHKEGASTLVFKPPVYPKGLISGVKKLYVGI